MNNDKLETYLNKLPVENGVLMGTTIREDAGFVKLYLDARRIENRGYTDKELKQLPYLENHPLVGEWKLRARSSARVKEYFSKNCSGRLLDLGCGNGWFSNIMAVNEKIEVTGLDINFPELEQASRVFRKSNLRFLHGAIYKMEFPEYIFRYITINAAIQYFRDFGIIVNRLMSLLTEDGEIHIIDSPFYPATGLKAAMNRTEIYYSKLGFPEMAKHYFHHSFESLKAYNYEIMYKPPANFSTKKLFGRPDIPFPWIRIKRYK